MTNVFVVVSQENYGEDEPECVEKVFKFKESAVKFVIEQKKRFPTLIYRYEVVEYVD
jgi:hypothetical protein